MDPLHGFKKGQAVAVIKAFGTGDGWGTVIGPAKAREYKGQILVDIGDAVIPVEPERLVDAEEYARKWRKRS